MSWLMSPEARSCAAFQGNGYVPLKRSTVWIVGEGRFINHADVPNTRGDPEITTALIDLSQARRSAPIIALSVVLRLPTGLRRHGGAEGSSPAEARWKITPDVVKGATGWCNVSAVNALPYPWLPCHTGRSRRSRPSPP